MGNQKGGGFEEELESDVGPQPFGSEEGKVWHKGRAGWSNEKRKRSMRFGRSVWGHETRMVGSDEGFGLGRVSW